MKRSKRFGFGARQTTIHFANGGTLYECFSFIVMGRGEFCFWR
jgi:hypothetical protein